MAINAKTREEIQNTSSQLNACSRFPSFHPLPVGNVFIFNLTDDGGGFYICGGFSDNDFALSCGNLTFTAVATPEPSSVALVLSGVGLVFAMRKRQGLSQAS